MMLVSHVKTCDCFELSQIGFDVYVIIFKHLNMFSFSLVQVSAAVFLYAVIKL